MLSWRCFHPFLSWGFPRVPGMNRIPILALLLFLQIPASVRSAFGLRPDGHLDMVVLRKAYMESDFEKVQSGLEAFQKHPPADASLDERIFTHLYLGVIYAADSNAVVKAESHFNALLRLSPHIEPLDMFVPPRIQELFDRVKHDYLKREEYEKRYDSFGKP